MNKDQQPGTSKRSSKPFSFFIPNVISFSCDRYIFKGDERQNVQYSPTKDKVELVRLDSERCVKQVEANIRLKFYRSSAEVRQGLSSYLYLL